jgi:hypothetical protein
MKSFIAILFFFNISYAANNSENVDFPGLNYPIEKLINSIDKDNFMFFETPYSTLSTYDFDTVILQGETQNSNINIKLSIKKDNQINEIKPNFLRIYTNGRFWARFDLNYLTREQFKISFYNQYRTNANFKIVIYEIQTLRFQKKTKEQEVIISTNNLSLPDNIPFTIIRRNEWKAQPPKENYIPHTPMAITIHHTAGHYPQTLEESIAEIQFIQDYHQNAKGWIDIGYQFLVDPMGHIFEGRPFKAVGAHVANKNTNNIGISIMGNYHPPKNDAVKPEILKAIIDISNYLVSNYEILESSFRAHRDLASTDCPGDILYSYMPYLRGQIFQKPLDLELDYKDMKYSLEQNADKQSIRQLLQYIK